MSEELLHEETQNEGTPVTMADLEEQYLTMQIHGM